MSSNLLLVNDLVRLADRRVKQRTPGNLPEVIGREGFVLDQGMKSARGKGRISP
jgi:hypothetical protein